MPDAAVSADDVAEVLGDFRSFCSLLAIRIKEGGQIIPFHWEDWFEEQKRFDCARTGMDVVLKPRQIGFTTVELARDLWFAMTRKGVNVQVIVHDARLAKQLWESMLLFKDCLVEAGLFPETRYSTEKEVVFKKSGSAVRIVEAGSTEQAASKKGRSGTIHRLHMTEVAFWSSAYETMRGVKPSAKDAEEIVSESTANGEGGLFHEQVMAAQAGTSGYKLHFFAWFEHAGYERVPGVDFDPEPVDEHESALRRLGVTDRQMAWWREGVNDPDLGLHSMLQDYPYSVETCFRSAGDEFMDEPTRLYLSHSVRDPIREAPISWKGKYYGKAAIYQNPQPGRQYVIGGDIAEGEGVEKDYSACCVLDRKTGRMCAVFSSNKMEPGDFAYVMAVLGYMFNTAQVGPERNNHGHTVLRVLRRELKYPKIYRTREPEKNKAIKWGWETNLATRPPLFDDIYAACRTKVYDCPDAQTCSEARTLILGSSGRPVARNKGKKGGAHDDRFVAWAIAHQMRSVPEWKGGTFNHPGA